MAETDTILQLGIEAAREGNREEARNLFNLVTRQDPNNAQGWLWLAGVADGPEERRVALEHVVELEPNNEMAVRGLQAMGVSPAFVPPTSTNAPLPVEVSVPATPARNLSEEEMYASELDSAFDDYDTVEKVAPPPREYEPTPVMGAGETGTQRVRTQPRRSTTRRDDASAPMPRRNLLYALIALLVLAVLFFFFVLPRFQNNGVATTGSGGNVTSTAGGSVANAPTDTNGASVTGGVTDTTGLTNTGTVNGTTGISDTGTVSGTGTVSDTGVTVAAPTTVPAAPAAPAADVSGANPQPVAVGTQLSANGYNFTYPNANYTAVLGKQVGGATAQGNYVLVLVQVANTTGTAQPVAADYFVLKDAQGQVYSAQPQASSAYVRRGVNADLSQEDAIPADGLSYSVPLIFDVPSGATNLVLFARGNAAQGFSVLNAVP